LSKTTPLAWLVQAPTVQYIINKIVTWLENEAPPRQSEKCPPHSQG